MSLVSLSHVSFAYDGNQVIDDVSLDLTSGEIVALIGPSGCGKSTLLRLIARLEAPLSGVIEVTREDSDSHPLMRLLFQDYDAYPWHTVWENVRIGSGPKPYPEEQTVSEILLAVGLLADRDRYPAELSGGMRKRLALARCLVRRPAVLLLDEPFASLDALSRESMYELLQKLFTDTQCAAILVTHDVYEAVLLADKIIVSTQRPLSVFESFRVDLARPRTSSVVDSAQFVSIHRQVMDALRSNQIGLQKKAKPT
jgi:sulfonate transport system ATP-binding protein